MIVPFLDDPELLDAASEAVAASPSPDDLLLLRRGLASKDLNLRVAAVRGLGKADPKAQAELRALLDDAEPRLALAAAHTLAERGDRAALVALVRWLRQKTNTSESAASRSSAPGPVVISASIRFRIQRFKKKVWHGGRPGLPREGRTAKLNLPLRLAPLPEDLRRGLLLHYTFDRDGEGRLTDRSGQGRHGTLHNEHAFVVGVAGKALEVRGTGDTGDAGGHALLPFIDFTALEQFTVALWVNERGMSDEHGEAYVVFGADRKVGVEDSLGISHFNDGIIFRVGGALVRAPFDQADRNRWVHYALTYQGGAIRGYKDGRLVGEAKGPVVLVGKQAALGRHWWDHGAATSARFIGAFDELRIYRRALSPSQIERLRTSSERKQKQPG